MKKIIISNGIIPPLQRKNSFLSRSDIKVFSATSIQEAARIHQTVHADLVILGMEGNRKRDELSITRLRRDAGPGGMCILAVYPGTDSARFQGKKSTADSVFFGKDKARRVISKAIELLGLSWRETYRVLLNIAVEGHMSDMSFSCRSIDISSTGMLLETKLELKKGDKIICSFVLPDATNVETQGEIVRTIPKLPGEERSLYGVHFTTVDEKARMAIEKIMDPEKVQ